jgi:YidC/Oxa1 family membrane protein insertase
MRKNMPKEALEGQAAQMQKIMLYVFPVFFLIGGFNFPIGVLIYWFVSNLWTMGQQFYVIRRNPAPGTPAFDAMQARKREHNLKAGRPADADESSTDTITEARPVARQQPKRQSRSDRRVGGAAAPAASAPGTSDEPPSTASSNGQTKPAGNGQQPAAKKAAAKQPAAGAKRQPAAKSRAARQAAQKKAAQKKSGGTGRPQDR